MNELTSFIEARLDADVEHAKQLKRLGLHLEGWERPDRDLREVAAKRAIVAIHRSRAEVEMDPDCWKPLACHGCGYSGVCEDPDVEDINECPELRALAAVYSDHPDYRAGEWSL